MRRKKEQYPKNNLTYIMATWIRRKSSWHKWIDNDDDDNNAANNVLLLDNLVLSFLSRFFSSILNIFRETSSRLQVQENNGKIFVQWLQLQQAIKTTRRKYQVIPKPSRSKSHKFHDFLLPLTVITVHLDFLFDCNVCAVCQLKRST